MINESNYKSEQCLKKIFQINIEPNNNDEVIIQNVMNGIGKESWVRLILLMVSTVVVLTFVFLNFLPMFFYFEMTNIKSFSMPQTNVTSSIIYPFVAISLGAVSLYFLEWLQE